MKSLRNPKDVGEVISRSQSLAPQTPRRWGKMSATQMLCHVNDGFRLYMGEICAAPLGFPYPSKLLKWGCLWVPVQWPTGFRTVPEVDQQRIGAPPASFQKALADLSVLLNRFAGLTDDFAWPVHPFLGQMSRAEWMRLGYLHTDHHLRQFGV